MRPPPPLIGRDRESAAIDEMLATVESGRLGTILIQAKPGLGASTMLAVAVGKAREKRFRILLAAAHEFEIHWPFATIAELLDLRAADPDPKRSRLQSELVREIERGREAPNEPAFAKRMVDALLGFQGPTLIAIEDLHFTDDQSIATLNRALRRGRDQQLGVILTCREGEPRQRVRGLLESLHGDGSSFLRLAPLTAAEVDALATPLFGAKPSPTLGRRLADAGGYPLWIVEYAEQALASDLVVINGDADLVSQNLPADFTDYVTFRASPLSASAKEVLEWLSLATEASTALIVELMDCDSTEVARALQECTLAGFLTEADGSWKFAQELVREAVYSNVAVAGRLDRHAALAERLETMGAPAVRVADQWLLAAAEASREVVGTLRLAASRLIETAPFQALRLLRRADEVAIDLRLSRVEILSEKAHAALNAGAAGDASRSAQTLLDTPEARPIHPGARMMLGRALLLERRYDEAARAFSSDPEAEEPLAIAYQALAHAWSFDVAATEECLRRFDRFDSPQSDAAMIANAARVTSLHFQGRVEEAADLASSTFLEAAGTGAGEARIRWMFCELLAFADRQEESQRLLAVEEGRATSATPHVAAGLMYVSALNRYLLGQWQGLDELLAAAAEMDPDRDSAWIESDLKLLRARLGVHQDEIELAERLTSELVATGVISDVYFGVSLTTLQLLMPSNRGRIGDLLETATEQLSAARSRGVHDLHWQECQQLVRAAVQEGDTELAVTCTEIASDVATLNNLPSAKAIARVCRAMVEQDGELAIRAAELAVESPRRVLQASINESAGAVLAEVGQKRASVDHFVAALRIYDELGATRDAARLVSSLRPLGVTRQKLSLTEPQERGWAALTPGEWRVVRLAARGHTTPAIAERLFLSPRTVQTHLRSSFRKLGVSTRAELAAVVSQWMLSNDARVSPE